MKKENGREDNEHIWDNRDEEYQKLKEKIYLNSKKMLVGELERTNNEGSLMRGW